MMAPKELGSGTGTWPQVTDPRTPLTALPRAGGVGARETAAERARESFFESVSRELRCALDEDGRLRHLEGAWQSLLGWQPHELRGWPLGELVHAADRPRVEKALARLRDAGGCERDLEMRLAVSSGGHRVVTWTMIAGPSPDSILGVGHDRMSERVEQSRSRRAAARLERQNAELVAQMAALEERYTAVERFAAVAAHQLSEPLIVAESSAIMLSEELVDTLDETFLGRLDAIGRSAARTRRLIDALLAEARAAESPPTLRMVDTSAVLEDALAALRPRMEERRVTAVGTGLPTLRTEPLLLSIILDNLLSNAVKYGPRSGGEVRVSADRVPSGWQFSVQSGGATLDPEESPRIFDPFRRAAGERRASGRGLGLTICSRLVARLGGTIGVRPAEDGGNIFFFVLPDPS